MAVEGVEVEVEVEVVVVVEVVEVVEVLVVVEVVAAEVVVVVVVVIVVVVVAVAALPTNRRFLAVTLGEGEGGPYHPPLWQVQRKEDSSCGNCGKTRVGWGRSDGGTGNSRGSRRQWELLKSGRGCAQRKSSIDSAGLLRFLIGLIRRHSSR